MFIMLQNKGEKMAIIICPSCGGKISTTRTTCIHCGYKLEAKKVCPECEESIDANASECPVCGYIFNHSEDNISILTEKETKKETKPEQKAELSYISAFQLSINDDGTYNLIGVSDAGLKNYTEICIPSEISGRTVTSIGEGAFADCDWIVSITLPATITRIDYSAFAKCTGLNEVHITDLDAWRNIIFENGGANPLHGGARLFVNGECLTELVINSGNILPNTFTGCLTLTGVTISDGVTEIGECAFRCCKSLTNVIIGNGVTKIGSSAFAQTALKSVTIPDNVTEIDSYAFHGCKALNSVTIPASGIHIRKNAFENCPNLSGGIHKRSVSKQKEKYQDVSSTEKTTNSDVRIANKTQKGGSKLLRAISLALTFLTILTFIVGVAFLFGGMIRYPAYDSDGTSTYNLLPFHITAFSSSLVGSTRATNCLFTLIGTILMAISLVIKFIVETKYSKFINKIITVDIISILATAVAIVFSFLTVDYGNDTFLVGAILIASCGILITVHTLLSIIKKKVCGK